MYKNNKDEKRDKILAYLKEKGSATRKEIMKDLDLTYAETYPKLHYLRQDNLIEMVATNTNELVFVFLDKPNKELQKAIDKGIKM